MWKKQKKKRLALWLECENAFFLKMDNSSWHVSDEQSLLTMEYVWIVTPAMLTSYIGKEKGKNEMNVKMFW